MIVVSAVVLIFVLSDCICADHHHILYNLHPTRHASHHKLKERDEGAVTDRTIPSIEEKKWENVTVRLGMDANFTCTIRNMTPDTMVVFLRRLYFVPLWAHYVRSSGLPDRYVVTVHQNVFTLYINDVELDDRDWYICQITKPAFTEVSGYLEVLVSPDVVSENSSSDTHVREGESTSIFCVAQGVPKPHIYWHRVDGLIPQHLHDKRVHEARVNGSILYLTSMTRGDAGRYRCIASNGVPAAASKDINVFVHYEPTVTADTEALFAPLGSNVTLICEVECYPQALYTWLKEIPNTKGRARESSTDSEIMLLLSGQRHIVSTRQLGAKTTMKYNIVHLTREDLGKYRCHAINPLGNGSATINIYELEVDVPSTIIMDKVIGNEASSNMSLKFSSLSTCISIAFINLVLKCVFLWCP